MKNLLLSAGAVLSLVMAGQAHAGFHLDPFLGYETGKSKSGGSDTDLSAISYGARIGWRTLGFSFGGEAALSNVTIKDSPEVSANGTDLGAFVGYDFPVMVRVYGTYILSSASKFSSGGSDYEFTGTGSRIGVGYTGFPFVTINLELLNRSFDKAKVNGVGGFTTDTKLTTTMLSLSVPL